MIATRRGKGERSEGAPSRRVCDQRTLGLDFGFLVNEIRKLLGGIEVPGVALKDVLRVLALQSVDLEREEREREPQMILDDASSFFYLSHQQGPRLPPSLDVL